MAFGRRQHNLTLLADGSVLATGGNSTGASLIDMNGGVFNAERWDPATGQWTTLAAQAVTRQYHSTALLLPDGRVLSSGGGICGTCDDVGYSGEERRALHTAVPVQERRLRAAGSPSRDHERARHGQPRDVVPDHHAERRFDQQGRADPAGVANTLDRDGAALPPALLHRRHRHADGERARKHEHRRPRHLHALHRRLRRRPVRGEHGRT